MAMDDNCERAGPSSTGHGTISGPSSLPAIALLLLAGCLINVRPAVSLKPAPQESTTAAARKSSKSEPSGGPQNPQGTNVLIVVVVWLGIFAASLGAGYGVGSARSIDFENSKSDPFVVRFVRDKAIIQTAGYRAERAADGTLIALSPLCVYRFKRGFEMFVYDAGTKTVSPEAAPLEAADWTHPPRNGLTLSTTLSLLTGSASILGASSLAFAAPTIGSAVTVAGSAITPAAALSASGPLPSYSSLLSSSSGSSKISLIIWGILGLMSGFAIGYKWAYRDQPDFGKGRPSDLLKNPLFWQSVHMSKKPARWIFETRSGAVLVKLDDHGEYVNVRRGSGNYYVPLSADLGSLSGSSQPAGPQSSRKTFSQWSFQKAGEVRMVPLASTQSLNETVPSNPYVVVAPPPEVLEALKAVNEEALARELVEQGGQNRRALDTRLSLLIRALTYLNNHR